MTAAAAQWQALTDQPLTFVGERVLAACLPAAQAHSLPALLAGPRFEARLLRLLLQQQHLTALHEIPTPAQDDLPVLLLEPAAFARLPRLCGAVLHGAALSREIRGEVVVQLRELLGADVFALALAHRAMAGAADLLRQPAELLQAVDRDGLRCVHAWLAAQPKTLQAWLRLRLADTVAGVNEPGPCPPNAQAIVRLCAATLQPPEPPSA